MSLLQISHSPDLQRLQNEGYEIEISSGFLVVNSIPYINQKGETAIGVLVSDLSMAGNITVKPANHVIHFIGEHPCDKDGTIMTAISHASGENKLTPDITINHSFSNKPPTGYDDYHHKITRYIEIISAPAKSIDPEATACTFKILESKNDDSPFFYEDTASSRAGIRALSDKLAVQKVAIIGLGGTGSYILDQLAKTPIREIHLYDGDKYLQHNAFRSPGAATLENLQRQLSKVDYYKEQYSNMHKGIVAHNGYLIESDLPHLNDFNFIFLCIDDGLVKKPIIEYLMSNKIPFIDVGMGLHLVNNELLGTCRVTTSSNEKSDHISDRISFCESLEDDEYSQNIQIADMNALNAVMAVIKWKKICGFYQDLENEHNSTYSTNVNQMTSDESL